MKFRLCKQLPSHHPVGVVFLSFSASLLLAFLLQHQSFFLAALESQAAYAQQPTTANRTDQEARQMLSIAEAEHEIVKLLIQQGQFQRVIPEMRKILNLDLPLKYEEAVSQSASLIAEMLVERKQFAIAHELIEESQKRMRKSENKAALWKIQAYVYKTEGNVDKALECLERAIDLERTIPRP